MHARRLLALDAGTSSVRALAGEFDGERLQVEECGRFYHEPVAAQGAVLWDMQGIARKLEGLETQAVGKYGRIDSLSLDSWGTDMVALDAKGALLTNGVSTRDPRFRGLKEAFFRIMPRKDIYARTGIQFLDWNSLYLLYALMRDYPMLAGEAAQFLFAPDYFLYYLTGEKICDYTIASTSQMLNPYTRVWDAELVSAAGVRLDQLLAPRLGGYLGRTRAQGVEVYSGCSHDTAAAVAGIPLGGDDELFIIAGSWAMMGAELDRPVITPASACFGFSNEGGIDGRIRFLKNSMGMWLMQECRREWQRQGMTLSFAEIAEQSAKARPYGAIINVNDPRLQPSGDLPSVIRTLCTETNQTVPQTVGEIARTVSDSLAFRFRLIKEQIEACTGRRYARIHVVAGGSQDASLCQAIADVCACPVVAGPVEASAYGNCASQLIASGYVQNLRQAREIIKRSARLHNYDPHPSQQIEELYAAVKDRISASVAQ